jgi:hypothetical protein
MHCAILARLQVKSESSWKIAIECLNTKSSLYSFLNRARRFSGKCVVLAADLSKDVPAINLDH